VEHVERLAQHARQGKVWDKAVRYLRQAGAKAFLRSANREAATCFEQALDAVRRMPEHPDAIAESIDLRFDLRNALHPLAEKHYRQAVTLAEELGLRPLLAHCHLAFGERYQRGARQPARDHLATAVTMFGEMDMRYWREHAEAELKELT
jgi:hypothetical protein